jgi:GNAT superfamily N-acetyltransferase
VLVVDAPSASPGLKPVVGFVSLVNATLPLRDPPKNLRYAARGGSITGLLLARMAVDERHKRRRLGEFLLKFALDCGYRISQLSGCPVVFVDAKDETAKAFYVKYGFLPLPDEPLRLYLPMETIRKIIAP